MTQQTVQCPQCDASVLLLADQKHCRCAYCGSKFAVSRPDAETLQLTRFESILQTPLDGPAVQVVGRRLTELETAIPDADDQVEAKRAQLSQAQSAHQQAIRESHQAIAGPQNWTLAVGFVAVAVFFLVAFVLERAEWYLALALTVLLVLAARNFYLRWQRVEGRARARLQDVRETIAQAESGLNASLTRREDCVLERELCQKQVSYYRSTSAPRSAVQAEDEQPVRS